MIVEIIPEKRTGPDKDVFSYKVPESLVSQIAVGAICYAPFGKHKIRGVVTKIFVNDSDLSFDYELKEISSVMPELNIPALYIEIARWISEYYLCSLGEAISLFLPPKIIRPRKALKKDKAATREEIKLTADQEKIFLTLLEGLKDPQKPALVHGVTGSGKTEIYLELTKECLKLGKQVIVLVPEIMLTPQTVDRFEEVFGDQICLMHSNLSMSERYSCYYDFYSGKKPIIIGPRSALLVPSSNIGLIIIDEEQEDAYKQEKDPRYHAVDLAEVIAEKNKILLVLGSATPRIETYYKAKSKKYDLFTLSSRYHQEELPRSYIIDMKEEIKAENFSPISAKLRSEIEKTLANNKQILLFLNRRGMSTFVSCRECGEVINCQRCAVPLVYHDSKTGGYLSCHHCDYTTNVPGICPSCGSTKIKFFGAGVERIEKEITKLFPMARVRKIDSQSLQKKGDYDQLHKELHEHKIDILIGTQILAKGLDVPTVDLVGVVSADVGLHLPHFRASEKTFQILTQVSGRSGRRHNQGQTVIQTYWPESGAIKFAAKHDFEGFYNSEIVDRAKLKYPPFCHLVRVVSQDRYKTKAKEALVKIAEKLKGNRVDFIGPGPCFLSRINNMFRYHLIIKTNEIPSQLLNEIYRENPYITWDSDPVDLL